MKKVLGVYGNPNAHWVGDGFPVRSLFSYNRLGEELSPFLLLDYAGPAEFEPATQPRGVGTHPHRGFETVTLVYQGEVAHQDSTGEGGVIGPSDVQWMTAGAGILHEEFHSPAFTQTGGALEMIQLWVNLPARHKMAVPGYQALVSDEIPNVALPDNVGSLRVIAGDYQGNLGPAHTFSPINVWDMKVSAGNRLTLPVPEGWSTAIVVMHGDVRIGDDSAHAHEVMVLSQKGSGTALEVLSDAQLLVLAGEPLNEPIVGHGPFVMNTQREIAEAITDFHHGRFGHMSS